MWLTLLIIFVVIEAFTMSLTTIWTVTSADRTEIPENTICTVTKVQGNTLEIKQK